MSGGSETGGTGLELSVDSLGGGDAESATRFTSRLFSHMCGNVRTHGEFVETGDQCTATRQSDGLRTVTTLTRIPERCSVVWVRFVAPLEAGDAPGDAVGDVVEAVRSGVRASTD